MYRFKNHKQVKELRFEGNQLTVEALAGIISDKYGLPGTSDPERQHRLVFTINGSGKRYEQSPGHGQPGGSSPAAIIPRNSRVTIVRLPLRPGCICDPET